MMTIIIISSVIREEKDRRRSSDRTPRPSNRIPRFNFPFTIFDVLLSSTFRCTKDILKLLIEDPETGCLSSTPPLFCCRRKCLMMELHSPIFFFFSPNQNFPELGSPPTTPPPLSVSSLCRLSLASRARGQLYNVDPRPSLGPGESGRVVRL